MSYCAAVTDAGVAALAAACPQLEVLRLDELSKVTDVGVATVAASCKRLRVCVAPVKMPPRESVRLLGTRDATMCRNMCEVSSSQRALRQ